MSADAQAVLLLVGQYGGRALTTLAAFGDLGDAVTESLSAGWLTESGGFYLMGAAGENALAAALDG